jgi:hypothetical protein
MNWYVAFLAARLISCHSQVTRLEYCWGYKYGRLNLDKSYNLV